MESSDEESGGMNQRDWQRMNNSLCKAGYRDGIDKGREENLQHYFDRAYQLAFKHSIQLGQLKGVIEALMDQNPEVCDSLKELTQKVTNEEESIRKHVFLSGQKFEAAGKAAEKIWDKNREVLLCEFKISFPVEAECVEKLWNVK